MRTMISLLTVLFVSCLLIGCGETSSSDDGAKTDSNLPVNEQPEDMRPPSMRDID